MQKETRQKIEMPCIFTADGRTPNACVLLTEACFNIPAGSYLLIDTDTPYIDGKLSVVRLDGKLRLLIVDIVDDEVTLFTADNFSKFMERDERIERVQYVGVVLQAVIDVNAEFSSERFHASLHPEANACGEVQA